jgi:hypothetical protein
MEEFSLVVVLDFSYELSFLFFFLNGTETAPVFGSEV